MSLYDLALSIAAFLILITMFARLNDLDSKRHKSFIWWVRRLAFLQVIAACSMVMAAPIAKNVPHWMEMTRLMFSWGVFWVFFTSPYQKPWWELIVGEHRENGISSLKQKAQRELVALKRSFFIRGTLTDRRHDAPDTRQDKTDRRTS